MPRLRAAARILLDDLDEKCGADMGAVYWNHAVLWSFRRTEGPNGESLRRENSQLKIDHSTNKSAVFKKKRPTELALFDECRIARPSFRRLSLVSTDVCNLLKDIDVDSVYVIYTVANSRGTAIVLIRVDCVGAVFREQGPTQYGEEVQQPRIRSKKMYGSEIYIFVLTAQLVSSSRSVVVLGLPFDVLALGAQFATPRERARLLQPRHSVLSVRFSKW